MIDQSDLKIKRKYYLIVVLLASMTLFAQHHLKINDKFHIRITDWIANIPKDKNLENKYIVLEFWASWCSPCLNAVPHCNELQEKFKNQKNLYFISLTDENPNTIKSVLERLPFKTIVVSDHEIRNQFWNNTISSIVLPLTLLIDDCGRIKWIGMPSLLHEDSIEQLIAGTLEPFSIYANYKKK